MSDSLNLRLACSIVLVCIATDGTRCRAQQDTGAGTLQHLLNTESRPDDRGASQDQPLPKADPVIVQPKGTLRRPEHGVQHPDLDKAWESYNVVVADLVAGMREAIKKEFEAAASKGDLDTAEKWDAVGKRFEANEDVVLDGELKAIAKKFAPSLKEARSKLGTAYQAVVKSLTIEKKITDAKALRTEWATLSDENSNSVLPERKAPKEKVIDQLFIEARVDGDSELWVTPSGIYWRSLGVAKPGRHAGRNEPTFVNGQAWWPQWGQPNEERGHDKTAQLAINVGELNLGFEVVAIGNNRGDRGIQSRSPVTSRREGDNFVVTIPDKNSDSRWYTVRLFRIPAP